jgi:hypothetical protein
MDPMDFNLLVLYGVQCSQKVCSVGVIFFLFFLEFTRPKGTEILGEFTARNLLEPAVMLNTTDEQHTLSQPTRRRANTAHGKECRGNDRQTENNAFWKDLGAKGLGKPRWLLCSLRGVNGKRRGLRGGIRASL